MSSARPNNIDLKNREVILSGGPGGEQQITVFGNPMEIRVPVSQESAALYEDPVLYIPRNYVDVYQWTFDRYYQFKRRVLS